MSLLMSNLSAASVGTTKTSLVKRRTIVPSGNESLTTTVLASGNSKRSTGASGTTLLSQLPRLGFEAAKRSQPYFTSADVTASAHRRARLELQALAQLEGNAEAIRS